MTKSMLPDDKANTLRQRKEKESWNDFMEVNLRGGLTAVNAVKRGDANLLNTQNTHQNHEIAILNSQIMRNNK